MIVSMGDNAWEKVQNPHEQKDENKRGPAHNRSIKVSHGPKQASENSDDHNQQENNLRLAFSGEKVPDGTRETAKPPKRRIQSG
jgi:hypothetical protein